MTAEEQLRNAIEIRLRADPHVKTAFGTGLQILAQRPSKEVFPYAVVSVQGANGQAHYEARVTVITHRESKADIARYLDAFQAALCGAALDVPGHDSASCRVRLRDILSDDSCKTRDGILHLKIKLNTTKNNGNN